MEVKSLPKWVRGAVEQIATAFHPRRIVMFGSYARGDQDHESDVDLFIEMETALSPPERAVAIASLFGLRPWSMDVVVYTPEEVEQSRGIHGTLLSQIEREGMVLYEQA